MDFTAVENAQREGKLEQYLTQLEERYIPLLPMLTYKQLSDMACIFAGTTHKQTYEGVQAILKIRSQQMGPVQVDQWEFAGYAPEDADCASQAAPAAEDTEDQKESYP